MTGEEWRVESGEWRVESGEWRVESGEWRVMSEEWRDIPLGRSHARGVTLIKAADCKRECSCQARISQT